MGCDEMKIVMSCDEIACIVTEFEYECNLCLKVQWNLVECMLGCLPVCKKTGM